MATFLLYWNPHFSSYKIGRFINDFPFAKGKDVLTEADEWDRTADGFDWSIIEHEKAHKNDRFIFVRVGYEKPTGLIGVGRFISEPFQDRDWSGQGRKVFYMKMEWESVVNPTSDKILKTSDLIEAVPEINWTSGKAGVLIDPATAEKIETLWKNHLESVIQNTCLID